MKIAILADLHLGYERFGADAYVQAAEALEQAYKAADVILIAGDIFDSRHPKPEVLAEAINLFRELSKKEFGARIAGFEGEAHAYTEVPVLAIAGTHERRSEGAANAVGLLGLAGLLVDISQARAVVALNGNGERICVSGIGGIADERFKEALNRIGPKPARGMFNVFIFHQSVYDLLPFDESYIRIEELPDGFDLYVDGHIHNRVERACHGKPFLIPGSTVLTQLKEAEEEEKGFYVYDTTKKAFFFETISSRRLIIAELDVEGREPEEVRGLVVETIERKLAGRQDNPIIRLMLKGALKDGFRSSDIGISDMPGRFRGRAILEIEKKRMRSRAADASADALRNGVLETLSVRDYGIGMLMNKLIEYRYNGINPTLLFELLGSDKKKEQILREALELIEANGQAAETLNAAVI